MKFIVSETVFYTVESEDRQAAITARESGEGELMETPTTRRAFLLTSEKPIPRDQWPLWAKALTQFSKPEDKGLGDTVARMIGAQNSEAFKAWHLATLGRSCRCNGRQARLNIQYPLP